MSHQKSIPLRVFILNGISDNLQKTACLYVFYLVHKLVIKSLYNLYKHRKFNFVTLK